MYTYLPSYVSTRSFVEAENGMPTSMEITMMPMLKKAGVSDVVPVSSYRGTRSILFYVPRGMYSTNGAPFWGAVCSCSL